MEKNKIKFLGKYNLKKPEIYAIIKILFSMIKYIRQSKYISR